MEIGIATNVFPKSAVSLTALCVDDREEKSLNASDALELSMLTVWILRYPGRQYIRLCISFSFSLFCLFFFVINSGFVMPCHILL